MNAFWADLYVCLEFLSSVWGAIKPYREALMGLIVCVGGGIAAFKLGYSRQARRPEEALSEAAAYATRPAPTRLVSEDRDLLSDVKETLHDLVRAVRTLTKVIEEQGDGRRGGRR